MTIIGLVAAKSSPTGPPNSDNDDGPAWRSDFHLNLRKIAKESEGRHLTDPTVRELDGAVTINIDLDGNQLIDDVASWLSSAYGLIGDKDKTCWDGDDLLFYEGNYCTQNTVGSIPTRKWTGDYNEGFNLKRLDCFDNDEARSVIILPTFEGQDFIVCDHPTDCTKDDWTYVYVYKMPGAKTGIKIETFEETGQNEYVHMIYSKKNGLDGKISRIGAWSRE